MLGYLEHEGSILAAPAYGMHEVLLPDALAAGLHVEAYLKLILMPVETPKPCAFR